jgi:osmotically-inducible protein OsmY
MKSSLLVSIAAVFLIAACSSTGSKEPIQDNHSQRSIGRMLDDESIETKARSNIRSADKALEDANIIAISFNGVVLLAGQVPSTHLKQVAAQTAANIRYVRKVHNELIVGEANDFGGRSNDSWITTRIKSKMMFSTTVDPAEVKVVTESGVVYLMGLVDQQSADKAVDMARQTSGVQKVVRIFEYVD